MDDLFEKGGALQLMLKSSVDTMLRAELEDYLGYTHGASNKKKVEKYLHFSSALLC